jgi:hypothetical protein
MFFNSYLEKRLTEIDFNNFSVSEKNVLVSELANKEKVMFSEITPDYILNHHKQLKVKVLNEKCEAAIETGFVSSNGHSYRTNRDDQINMIGQKDELINDSSIETVMWKTEDADYVQHTKEEWMTVYQEAFGHKKAQLFKYNELKRKIMAAASHGEVLANIWD